MGSHCCVDVVGEAGTHWQSRPMWGRPRQGRGTSSFSRQAQRPPLKAPPAVVASGSQVSGFGSEAAKQAGLLVQGPIVLCPQLLGTGP